jgi:hypothetical protein
MTLVVPARSVSTLTCPRARLASSWRPRAADCQASISTATAASAAAVDIGIWLAAVPVIWTTFADLRLHPRNLVAGGRVTAERHYWPLVDGLVQLGLIGPSGHAVGTGRGGS